MAITLLANGLLACGGSGNDPTLTDTNGSSANQTGSSIRVAYVKRKASAIVDLQDVIGFAPGGDLYLRQAPSPDAEETNLTASVTQGQGDVAHPNVSPDGNKIIFSLRESADSTWGIWEYDLTRNLLKNILTDPQSDDIDPAYLPDGRIVFTSNRQARQQQINTVRGVEHFPAATTDGRRSRFLLHVMDGNGANIKQISFHSGHDLNPVPLDQENILFTRWDNDGQQNRYHLYRLHHTGGDLQRLYGNNSQAAARHGAEVMPDGRLIALLGPVSGSSRGGAPYLIDVARFSDQNQPDPSAFGALDNQLPPAQAKAAKDNLIPINANISQEGRFISPAPFPEDNSRILVSFSISRIESALDPISGTENDLGREGEPRYHLSVLDLQNGAQRPFALAREGWAVLDGVVVKGRTYDPAPVSQPNMANASDLSELDLFPVLPGTEDMVNNQLSATLHVLSVYDSAPNNEVGLHPGFLAPALEESLPQRDPDQIHDPRATVADIATIKQLPAEQRPARFFRLMTEKPLPTGYSATQRGATPFGLRKILGYGEVEPDGSILIQVPADTPLSLQILDSQGRAITPPGPWFQLRPRERKTLKGFYALERGNSIYAQDDRTSHPGANFQPQGMETMAQTRARQEGAADTGLPLQSDLIYQDYWFDNGSDDSFEINYLGVTFLSANEQEKLDQGILNYQEHIQPI